MTQPDATPPLLTTKHGDDDEVEHQLSDNLRQKTSMHVKRKTRE